MQDQESESRNSCPKNSFREVTVPIIRASNSSSGKSDNCHPSFKNVAVPIPIVAKKARDLSFLRPHSEACSHRPEEPPQKMQRSDWSEQQCGNVCKDQFAVIQDEEMESLFQGSAPASYLSPSTSPSHELEDESEPLEMNDDEFPRQGNDDMFDFCEIEEKLTFTWENENLMCTRDVDSDEQMPNVDAQPGSASADSTPLYPTAKVTLGTAMVLLALFSIKFNFSADAMGNLLSLLSLVLPAGHVLPTTVNKFKQYFRSLRTPMIFHYYCSFCLAYVGKNRDEGTCPNADCMQRDLKKNGAMAYFVEIPIVEQLRTMFSRSTFYDDIQYRFKKAKQPDGSISDVYDGRLYRELMENGPLNSKDNVSFTMNTDGVPVFKSSKVSIWPIYLIVNELPYNQRMSKENMLLSGLWFGEKKPAMWTFLKPQFESLRQLEKGVELEAPGRGKFTCKGVVLAWTCDLPARCLVCNHMQFNGEYGCWKCLQPGHTVKADGGHARAFPYQATDPKGPLRNMQDTLKHAREAASRRQAGDKRYYVMGVKGPTWLSLLEHYDVVRGVAIDYMHGVLLGVQKLLLKLWFSPSFAKKPYSISTLATVLDERLQHISPTLDIGRLPRSVTEHVKYWKASELKSFLLYYGMPTLYGLLPDRYFNHYILLVRAIYLLLKDTISESDVNEAERLLYRFCALFSSLYEERFMTLNIHQLLHLSDDVRELGPLFTHSCFSFEDKNGFILKQIHGTQSIDSQILHAISLTQKIPELRENCIMPETEEEKLYLQLMHSQKPKRGTEILPGVFMLGTPYQKSVDDDTFAALEQYTGHAPGSVHFTAYNRIEFKSSYIYGLSYKRMSRRNCATIKYMIQDSVNFGQVQYFIQYRPANAEQGLRHLAVVKPLCCRAHDPSSHICVVHPKEVGASAVAVIDITAICCNCIYISFPDEPDRAYVCEFPNKHEQE